MGGARQAARAGKAPKTAHKQFTLLHGIFERARRRKRIAVNPCADVDRIPLDKPSGVSLALDPTQVMALSRAAATPQEAALYIVAAFTGLRRELRALRWKHVRFGLTVAVELNLPEHGVEKLPKSGPGRSAPTRSQAAKALDDLSRRGFLTDDDDHVSVNALGGPVNGDIVRRRGASTKAAKLGGLIADELPRSERLRFHDLRHTFGTIAARKWPLSDVQAAMGHAHITTTMIYVHAQPRTHAATGAG